MEDNALLKWLNNNPEATNMGIGFLKSLREENQQKGRAQNEIAKTQYGYLLGQGVGDISKAQGPGMADRLMQGYVAGSQQRQQGDMNKAIKDMLTARANKDNAGAIKDNVDTFESITSNENPYNKSIVAQGRPLSEDIKRALIVSKQLGNADNVAFPALQTGLGLPSIMTEQIDGLARPMEDRKIKKEYDVNRLGRYPASTGGY